MDKLVAIDDLIDAVTAAAIAKIHPVFRYARRVHVMIASGGIGHAFVAIGPRSVVTALRCREIGGGLLAGQPKLTDENRVRRIAQIPDIDVLVRVPAVGLRLEDRVCDPGVAFPPDMMRRAAVVYENLKLRWR